jgi:glycosyltransferase involved in cell wall biosynthesis
MTIVMLATKFYARSDMGGGLERSARRLIRWLRAAGHDVVVLTRNYDRLPRRETIDGAQVVRFAVWPGGRLGASASYLVKALAWLVAHRRAYQVIHAHQAYAPATVAVLAKWLVHRPVVVKISTADAFSERRVLEQLPLFRLRRRLLRGVDRFVAVNPAARDEFAGLGLDAGRIIHIPNGIEVPPGVAGDADARRRARQGLGLAEGRTVRVIGRLSEKNIDVLIEAWPAVLAACPDARLVLVGDGGTFRSVEPQLRARVQALGLQGVVRFTGRVDDAERYLAGADCFVLPSRTEGMSNALLEAMAAGVPVVATDVPGNALLIDDGRDGVLVPPGDRGALACGIVQVLQDPARARSLADAARRKAAARFAMPVVGAAYLDVYAGVVPAADRG